MVQIIVNSHFDLERLPLDLDATETVSQTGIEMTLELINIHVISVQQKR